MVADHPYYPRDLSLPHYVPNERSMPEILAAFFAFTGVVLVAMWVYAGRLPHMAGSTSGKLRLCWFMMCGLIHFVLEGYFSVFHKTFPASQDFLAQIWKEYSKADSRYATGDSFTVMMEGVTAFVDGPLCFLVAFLFVRTSPSRYVMQLIVSLFQLYGAILYWATEWKDDFIHGPKNDPLYFWFYFIFMNGVWIVVPSVYIIESVSTLTAVQGVVDKSRRKKSH